VPILCLFWALGLALAPAAANGAETLAQALREADAKYLAVKALKPIDTAPKIATGEEEEGRQRQKPERSRKARSGRFSATWKSKRSRAR
jgi:hypothetical protein